MRKNQISSYGETDESI